jgi:4-amino-4-deoxy-L-arabinose transferase-like glycosyltransferase
MLILNQLCRSYCKVKWKFFLRMMIEVRLWRTRIFQAPNVIIFILLFIALMCRGITYAFQLWFGIHSISWVPGAVAYTDFFSTYRAQLQALSQGFMPYRDFPYFYTPLFIYGLYPFYLLGGIELAAIPILVADAATAPLVYSLTKSVSSKRIALVAGIAYALCPLALFEEGYLFLSSQPMVFFLLISIYLLRKDKPSLASLFLAFSILFKQEALFVLPIYLIYYLTRFRSCVWRSIGILGGTLFLTSLPFLIISPVAYLVHISYGIIPIHVTTWSYLVSIVPPMTNQTHSLSLTTCSSPISYLPTTKSYVFCGATYSWSNRSIVAGLMGLVPWVASVSAVPAFLLTLPTLYLSRTHKNILLLSCAYSLTGFLILFSFTVHEVFSYYFLPVYAILFACATNKRSALVVALISGTSILLADATMEPVLLSSLGLLYMLAVQDSNRNLESHDGLGQ